MQKISWGTSKNAQNPRRNFQICTKCHEDLPKMHKISWLISNNAQNPTRIFRKCTKSHDWLRILHKILWVTAIMYTIPWGTLKYAQSYEELPKMHKIPRCTSKTAQNHMRNFQNCTKSHDVLPKLYKITRNFQKGTKSHKELLKMHKIPWGTSKDAQNPTSNFQKCTKSQEKLSNMHKIPRASSENAEDLMIYFK